MRTSTDVIRSLAAYMSESLGAEWEVRFEDEEAAFARPYCRVQVSTPMQARVANVVVAECLQTFSFICYPEQKASPALARLEASRVEELLWLAFARGTHTSAYGRKQGFGLPDKNYQRGHPMRIPLYDFDGVNLETPVTDADRDPRDFLRVVDPPTIGTLEGTARGDEEEVLYVVTAEARCSWMRSAAVVTDGVPLEEIHLHPDYTP